MSYSFDRKKEVDDFYQEWIKRERLFSTYQVEASPDCIIIWGNLSVSQLIDLMQVYVQQGFKHVGVGNENSNLILYKEKQDV